MSSVNYIYKKTTKTQRYIIALICGVLYIMLIIVLAVLSSNNGIPSVQHELKLFSELKGVVTQVQMLISVSIVLLLYKEGYRFAVMLNIMSLCFALSNIIRSHNYSSISGIISYVVYIIIVTLVVRYERLAEIHLDKIDIQNKELERAKEKLYEQANSDSLTKLPNQNYLIACLEAELKDAQKTNRRMGVALIDLDILN